MEENNTSDGFFSKERCYVLIRQYTSVPNEQNLRAIITQIAKLELGAACESFLQDLMIDLLVLFNNIRNDVVDERIVSFLRGIKWFQQTFSAQDLPMRKFIKNFEVLRLGRYSKIVRRGENSDHFFVLVNGRASVLKDIEPERNPGESAAAQKAMRRHTSFIGGMPNPLYFKEVHELVDGEVFGDIGILYKRKRMATIVTKTNCVLIRIPAETFIQISAELTVKLHQKRLKFICDRLSQHFKDLCYEDLQHTVLEFEPVTYSYGSRIYSSRHCSHFMILEEGEALCHHYRHEGTNKILDRREIIGHGRFIGVRELLAFLDLDSLDLTDPQYQPYLQKILQFNQRMKQQATNSEEIIANSEQVVVYRVPKTFLIGLIKNHRQILCDLLDHRQCGLDPPQIPTRSIFKISCNTRSTTEPEQCRAVNSYKKMRDFIVRKRNELRARDKQNARV